MNVGIKQNLLVFQSHILIKEKHGILNHQIENGLSKKNIAWFDEDLDTWMKGCRGSGILEKQKGEWKLVYYNLTVLIENEKIKEFIKLRE